MIEVKTICAVLHTPIGEDVNYVVYALEKER